MPDSAAAPEPPPPPAPRLPFPLPAEYYASPERKPPIVPRALPFGCGAAALAFLIVFAVAGAMVSGDRGGRLVGRLFGTMQSEADGQFTKDVPAAQRAEFDAQFKELRARVTSGHAKLSRLQPFLEKLRDASMDERITPEETKTLIEALRAANKQ
jgi:hypothetical protein